MKKIKFILVLFVLALLASAPAFALNCKTGNDASDECWTNVKVASGETNVVIPGTVLMFDFAAVEGTSDTAAFNVRVVTASTQGYRVAGIAQQTIATGDTGLALVRGKGKARVSTTTASADRLYISGTGTLGTQAPDSLVTSHDEITAFALKAISANATDDVYVVVV